VKSSIILPQIREIQHHLQLILPLLTLSLTLPTISSTTITQIRTTLFNPQQHTHHPEVTKTEELLNRIIIDPKTLAGKPIIKGTRIPVYLIVELIANGMKTKELLKEYPELKPNDIKAALLYASKLLQKEITVAL